VRLLHPPCRVSSGSRRRWPFLSMGARSGAPPAENGRFSVCPARSTSRSSSATRLAGRVSAHASARATPAALGWRRGVPVVRDSNTRPSSAQARFARLAETAGVPTPLSDHANPACAGAPRASARGNTRSRTQGSPGRWAGGRGATPAPGTRPRCPDKRLARDRHPPPGSGRLTASFFGSLLSLTVEVEPPQALLGRDRRLGPREQPHAPLIGGLAPLGGPFRQPWAATRCPRPCSRPMPGGKSVRNAAR
jgi:hypothetical protein